MPLLPTRIFNRKDRVPRRFRRELKKDAALVLEERRPGKLLIQTVIGPNGHRTLTTEAFSACLLVSRKRLLLATTSGRRVNLPLDDAEDLRWRHLFVRTPMPELLAISYNAVHLEEGWEGLWEFRVNTENAQKIKEILLKAGLQKGSAEKR